MALPTTEQLKVLQALNELKKAGKIDGSLPFADQFAAAESMMASMATAQQQTQSTGPKKLYLMANENGADVTIGTEQEAAQMKADLSKIQVPDQSDGTSGTNMAVNTAFIGQQVLKNNGYGFKNFLMMKGPVNPSKFIGVNGFSSFATEGSFFARAGGFLAKGTGPIGGVIAAAGDLYDGGKALYNGQYDDAAKSGITATTTGLSTWGGAAAGAELGLLTGPGAVICVPLFSIIGGAAGFFIGKKSGHVIARSVVGETKSEKEAILAARIKEGPIEVDPALAQIINKSEESLRLQYAQQLAKQQGVALPLPAGTVAVNPNVGTNKQTSNQI